MKPKREDYTPGKATAAVILEKRRMKTDGLYPVMLRVTHERKSKYYGFKEYCSKETWDSMFDKKPADEAKKLKKKIDTWEEKADLIINDLAVFSFEHFEKKYFEASRNERDVFEAFNRAIKEYREAGRESTAVAYECAKNAIKKFVDQYYSGVLEFKAVTPGLLTRFEKWWIDQDMSVTSVGIYLRSLRALYNRAIFEKVVSSDFYPFGRRLYVIPKGRNIKKALTLEEVGRIYHYQAIEGSREQWARDMWMFSYLCNGMNVADICNLKYKNIDIDAIVFTRKKTEHTNLEGKKIVIPLTQEIAKIIDQWGKKPADQDNYVFGLLEGKLTPATKLSRVKDVTKQMNTHMAKIGKELKISSKISSYTARHSFASVLKRSGASIEMISESLGHSNLSTTENYLASFELDSKRKMAEMLTNFK